MDATKDIARKKDISQSPELTQQGPTLTPVVDIYENNDEILLFADLAGVSKEDLTINVENDTLRLTGNRNLDAPGTAYFEEFCGCNFHREFSLPQGIDVERVNAELKDGLLKLHMPKSAALKPRQIEIKAE